MIPKLTALPSYQAGQNLIIITWDEGDGSGTKGIPCLTVTEASCRVPTLVLSPYITPGAVDTNAAESLLSCSARCRTSSATRGWPGLRGSPARVQV